MAYTNEVADHMIEDVSVCYVIADKGYDSDKHRTNLESNNNIPVIPGRKNRKQPIIYDKDMYKMRKEKYRNPFRKNERE